MSRRSRHAGLRPKGEINPKEAEHLAQRTGASDGEETETTTSGTRPIGPKEA